MSGRHGHKRKKKKTTNPSALEIVVEETPCQEHPDSRTEDDMNEAAKNGKGFIDLLKDKVFDTAAAALFVSVLALGAYLWQACIMRTAMRVDQRAWISVPIPDTIPLDGKLIPITTKIKNTGKTPARDVEGDMIATVLRKGDNPTIGDFSIGHPHDHLYGGAISPDANFPMTPIVKHYGDHGSENIVPDDSLRGDVASGARFILVYGRITYSDAFGIQHWTQFCTGVGAGIMNSLKTCVLYNDFDSNEE